MGEEGVEVNVNGASEENDALPRKLHVGLFQDAFVGLSVGECLFTLVRR